MKSEKPKPKIIPGFSVPVEDCPHTSTHRSHINFTNVSQNGKYTDEALLEVRVWCGDCGNPWRFFGVERGSPNVFRPAADYDAVIMRLPMVAATESNHPGAWGRIPPDSQKH